jgi:hypothetical protein
MNITHTERPLRLLKDGHDRVSDDAELASAVRRNTRGPSSPWQCLLPFKMHETLEEGGRLMV